MSEPLFLPAAAPVAPTHVSLASSRALWLASSVDAVIDAATTLLQELVPGTRISRIRLDPASARPALDTRRALRVALPDREALDVVVPEPCCGIDSLRPAVELVEARLRALFKQDVLRESISRLNRSERVQRALYAIAEQTGASGNDLRTTLAALHQIVGSLIYARNFFVACYNAATDSVTFPYYADSVDPNPPAPDAVVPMAQLLHGPTWYVLHDGRPLMGSRDAMANAVSGPFSGTGEVSQDWLGVPLLHGEAVTGAVVVQSYDGHRYGERDQALLAFVAQHIQATIEQRMAWLQLERAVDQRTQELRRANAALEHEVAERKRGAQVQAALYRIAELAGSDHDLAHFYASVHAIVGGLIYARNFFIALRSDDDTGLEFPYLVDEHDAPPRRHPLGHGLTEYVLRHGTALLVDPERTSELQRNREVLIRGTHSESWLGVPLAFGGRVRGVLAVQSYDPVHRYAPADRELLIFVSYHIANALERVQAAEKVRAAYAGLEHQVAARTTELARANRNLRAEVEVRKHAQDRLRHDALHDSLTGLPNRRMLIEVLGDALAHLHADTTHGFAVLYMDLDRFKVINDSDGHLIGNELLVGVGQRIRAALKPDDSVARMGGDEFCVLLHGVRTAAVAAHVAQRIIDAVSTPFQLGAREIFTSLSVGIAMATPKYHQPDDLLRDADAALYRAKADGRQRHALFDEAMRQAAVAQLTLESDLRRGVLNREFIPHYQPIVALASGRVVGYEALARWPRSDGRLVLPDDFMEVAQDTNNIEAIDWQILGQVCSDADGLGLAGSAYVAVNLAAGHFRTADLDRRLLELLERHALPPARVHVEVTERAMLHNPPQVKRILGNLRAAGIGIALDDFGTGYSSLSYLHEYPVQVLKIDRSFVVRLNATGHDNSLPLVRTIMALADTLSLEVIAEGVETRAQRDILEGLGCTLIQGFLYARAEPIGRCVRSDTRLVAGATRPALSICA